MIYSFYNYPYNYSTNMYYNYNPYYRPYPYVNQCPATDLLYHNLRAADQNTNINVLKDYGPNPFVFNIEKATTANNAFRTAIWTGNHLQVTLMSINPGESIGLELHPDTDQFIRVESGEGVVTMGENKDNVNFRENLYDDFVVIVPAGKWHNIFNTGTKPLKLYSVYAPPQHPRGTIHQTKEIAMASEKH